ncbi:twitching motility protein PilT [Synergistales bacterium]|nr:twitching motility protein PilT [Synergistales bacterium]
MSDRVFIDTNLFVYAHVSDDFSKHRTAVELLNQRIRGESIIVSTQVLSEFYSAMFKYKRSHEEITMFLTDMARCVNVAPVSLLTVELSLRLKVEYGYSYWDSLILASAVENDCKALYSEDMQHGQIIENCVSIQNPFI